MIGTIGKWEILAHPLVTVQCFGWGVFFRALGAGHGRSFLSILNESGTFRRNLNSEDEFLSHCIELENRAKRIYLVLAERFSCSALAREFFENLAEQEQIHADILELCRAVVGRGRWRTEPFAHLHESVPRTEKELAATEADVEKIETLPDALRRIIQFESAQVNHLFTGVIRATDPRFPVKFNAFRGAIRDHFAYMRGQITVLAPELREDCTRLLCD